MGREFSYVSGDQRLIGGPKISCVIPCYRVRAHILGVIAAIGPEVSKIFVVDDACPENSGDFVAGAVKDPRVVVVRNPVNKGVGGAVLAGYSAALADGADIIVKVDGDGQMDPAHLPWLVEPIVTGEADYAKGNRFFSISATQRMPLTRLLGNAALSFLTKLSSGYWTLFDPTNGYTAIHKKAAQSLDFSKIAERYFFESDLLIHLGDIRAVVVDVPMQAIYADEKSNLKITSVAPAFFVRHSYAILRRLFYCYFVRDFNLASLNLIFGFGLFVFGVIFGAVSWNAAAVAGVPATTGTVMISVLPILIGVQMMLFFLGFDIANEPKRPLQRSGRITRVLGAQPLETTREPAGIR